LMRHFSLSKHLIKPAYLKTIQFKTPLQINNSKKYLNTTPPAAL